LFLDEIGDMPLELQPKLLTFLQERKFYRIGSNQTRESDVRIIAATHRDFLAMSEKTEVRRDLYFRLAVLRLDIPALRDRREEVRALSREILLRICRQRNVEPIRVDSLAMESLVEYSWPGNIRELENVLKNSSAFCEGSVVRIEDLNLPHAADAHRLKEVEQSTVRGTLAEMTLAEIERQAILDTWEHLGGNKAKTARSLGISEKSIYNKMRRHGLKSSKPKFEKPID